MELFLDAFRVGVWLGGGAVVLFGALYGLTVLINFAAERNVLFTKVKEGTAKAIMRWDQFHRFLIVYRDHDLDQEWNVRHDSLNGKEADFWDDGKQEKARRKVELRKQKQLFGGIRFWFFDFRGIFWIGIPPIYSVYEYEFRWIGFRQQPAGEAKQVGEEEVRVGEPSEQILGRKRRIGYILLQDDTYFLFLQGAETAVKPGQLIPVNLKVALTIRIVNPYQALFRVQDWLEVTLNLIVPVIRSYVARHEYTTIISGLKKTTKGEEKGVKVVETEEELRDESMEGEARKKDPILRDIANYVEARYGARIKKVGILSIEPPKEIAEAGTRQWVADREKERIETVYKTIQSFGDTGLLVRTLEAIEQAGSKQGNWVIPLGLSPQSILEAIRGQKKEEGK